jgi:hypothetical protein
MATPTAKASETQACLPSKADADNMAPQPRYFSPRDLAGALRRLDDAEIDALIKAIATEAERRGRLSPKPAAFGAKPQTGRSPTEKATIY